MSASPIARQAHSHAQTIPSKRVLVTDASQLPEVYSSTPGGTLYSTTPGGTRIIYERAFLMNLRNSPLSQTPPRNTLPAALLRAEPLTAKDDIVDKPLTKLPDAVTMPVLVVPSPAKSPPKAAIVDEEQFDMDI